MLISPSLPGAPAGRRGEVRHPGDRPVRLRRPGHAVDARASRPGSPRRSRSTRIDLPGHSILTLTAAPGVSLGERGLRRPRHGRRDHQRALGQHDARLRRSSRSATARSRGTSPTRRPEHRSRTPASPQPGRSGRMPRATSSITPIQLDEHNNPIEDFLGHQRQGRLLARRWSAARDLRRDDADRHRAAHAGGRQASAGPSSRARPTRSIRRSSIRRRRPSRAPSRASDSSA